MTDYHHDSVALGYARFRQIDDAVLAALREHGRVDDSAHVLEVGCGTGNYPKALQQQTNCRARGVDPSDQMLAVARMQGPTLRFVRATAEALPFGESDFDLVFSVDVIHHIGDLSSVIAEAFRVLRSGGRICLATDDDQTIKARLLTHYFPDTMGPEVARYPAIDDLLAAMTRSGFAGTDVQRAEQAFVVTDIEPYRQRVFSALRLISEEAHRRGLERLQRDLERGPVPGSSRHVLLWGTKP